MKSMTTADAWPVSPYTALVAIVATGAWYKRGMRTAVITAVIGTLAMNFPRLTAFCVVSGTSAVLSALASGLVCGTVGYSVGYVVGGGVPDGELSPETRSMVAHLRTKTSPAFSGQPADSTSAHVQ